MGQSAAFAAKYPKRAEALIWDGIVLSTYAGFNGGLGAMGPAKKSRQRFEAALAIDDTALDGSAYTSLGTLYHKMPGWPIGFGSDKKAREYLEKALQISPDAIDPNYFYGEFLYDNGDYANALRYLEIAQKAPPRPGREIADAGRQSEISALIAKTKKKLG
jgi:tetratricopeptide (TPR) repeat protein